MQYVPTLEYYEVDSDMSTVARSKKIIKLSEKKQKFVHWN